MKHEFLFPNKFVGYTKLQRPIFLGHIIQLSCTLCPTKYVCNSRLKSLPLILCLEDIFKLYLK